MRRLLTHEFMNMAAGGPDTILAVPKLSNESEFNWPNCEGPDCATLTKHMKERLKVDVVNFGSDAIDTPWTFDSVDCEHQSLEEIGGRKTMKRKRSDGTSSQSKASLLSPLQECYSRHHRPVLPLLLKLQLFQRCHRPHQQAAPEDVGLLRLPNPSRRRV